MTTLDKKLEEALEQYGLAITDNSGTAFDQEERIADAKQSLKALISDTVEEIIGEDESSEILTRRAVVDMSGMVVSAPLERMENKISPEQRTRNSLRAEQRQRKLKILGGE